MVRKYRDGIVIPSLPGTNILGGPYSILKQPTMSVALNGYSKHPYYRLVLLRQVRTEIMAG